MGEQLSSVLGQTRVGRRREGAARREPLRPEALPAFSVSPVESSLLSSKHLSGAPFN